MNRALVISPHQSESPIPLILKEGDFISGQEKETPWKGWLWCCSDAGIYGWVPKSYLKESYDKPGFYSAIKNYNAAELTVQAGEQLTIFYEESGWAWVENKIGDEG